MQPTHTSASSKKKNKKKNKNKGAAAANPSVTTQQQQHQPAHPSSQIPSLPHAAAGHPQQAYDYPTQNGQHASDSEEDGPDLGEMEGFQAGSSQPPPPSLTPATQAELLATANELYRQIEAAAAAALASTGGPNNPSGPQLAGQPNPQQANGWFPCRSLT